jgi:hypothetical protein
MKEEGRKEEKQKKIKDHTIPFSLHQKYFL